MPGFKPIDPQIRAEVLTKVRDEGMSVSLTATTYGVSSKTIYNWLRSNVIDGNTSLILQLNRLKKENEQLYNLLGRATAELKHPKS
jgi:transposase-like protein